MLEKNPSLTQAHVEQILESRALPMPPGIGGDVQITELFDDHLQTWGSDATGHGLIHADAVGAVP
jgi:hypothetical protein